MSVDEAYARVMRKLMWLRRKTRSTELKSEPKAEEPVQEKRSSAQEIRDDDDTVTDTELLAVRAPAAPEAVGRVLCAHVDGVGEHDGRSDWQWVRFRDGTLMLGVFPHGETYLETELDPGRP